MGAILFVGLVIVIVRVFFDLAEALRKDISLLKSEQWNRSGDASRRLGGIRVACQVVERFLTVSCGEERQNMVLCLLEGSDEEIGDLLLNYIRVEADAGDLPERFLECLKLADWAQWEDPFDDEREIRYTTLKQKMEQGYKNSIDPTQ